LKSGMVTCLLGIEWWMQVLKAAQGKVFEANCIFAGVCAPQVFVYSPGMYSSSNQDFVRGTVSSFYEMFKQVSIREEDEFRAFAFSNQTLDNDMVCPMDNMEWELKVRNQAMKKGCASVQIDGLKKSLSMLRIIVDTIVNAFYMTMQIIVCLFRLLLPLNGDVEVGQILAEIEFWFNQLILLIVQSIKELANMLFNLIFSSGPLSSVMKTILQWVCKIVQLILWVWNETGRFIEMYSLHALIASLTRCLLQHARSC
jgi:hypothetical protein